MTAGLPAAGKRTLAAKHSRARYARAAAVLAKTTLNQAEAEALASIAELTGETNAAIVRRLLVEEFARNEAAALAVMDKILQDGVRELRIERAARRSEPRMSKCIRCKRDGYVIDDGQGDICWACNTGQEAADANPERWVSFRQEAAERWAAWMDGVLEEAFKDGYHPASIIFIKDDSDPLMQRMHVDTSARRKMTEEERAEMQAKIDRNKERK